MLFLHISINCFVIFTLSLSFILTQVKSKNRTYDYRHHISGIDYVFEDIDGVYACMTAHFRSIKVGDRIILIHNFKYTTYLVVEINYYSNPSDIWTSLLRKTSEAT
jgi:MioC protein